MIGTVLGALLMIMFADGFMGHNHFCGASAFSYCDTGGFSCLGFFF